ncbi:MAG: spore coat associated protein CotJA [Eubacterium sp.]|jgi:hypothetical protein|nr:spore coat associated protein CotJA [Eubacterium sp.]
MRNCYQPAGCGAVPYAAASSGCPNAVSCTCHLAISTVPWQQLASTYEPEQAFRTGTIFPELDKPFLGRSVMRG